jgi:LacI family transcriptional regulator
LAATIKDVAKSAGVSIATVSYVLNRTRPVSRETAEKILQAIEELSYVPSRNAQSLVTKSTKMIGILITDICNSFFAPIVRGIEDEVNQSGYVIMVGNVDENLNKARRYLESIGRHSVDGLIISPTSGFEELTPILEHLNIPVVLVNRSVNGLHYDSVTTDNELGAYVAVKHLISRGHKKIGLVNGPLDVSTYLDRLTGYRKAFDEAKLPVDADFCLSGGYHYESGYQLTKQILSQPSKPSALFISSGWLTRGAYRAIKEIGVVIPEELSFISYDEPEWVSFVEPPLTTVTQQTYEMGRKAAELLLKRLGDKRPPHWWEDERSVENDAKPVTIKLEPNLIIRGSTHTIG